jgi:hypothetical protein
MVGRPERKRPLGRPRHNWESYIKIDLKEGGRGLDLFGRLWTGLFGLR